MPSARRDQRVSLLVNTLNATGTFWCSVVRTSRRRRRRRTHEWRWYELFVKPDGLFSDPRYDTRVCASNAREVRHNALYRHQLSSARSQRAPGIAS